MEIKEAKPEDAEKIVKTLWLPLAQEMEELSDYNEIKEDLNIQIPIDYKKEKLESENAFIFLVENESEPVAYLSGKIKQANPVFSRGQKLKISELFVLEEHRRKGLASTLIEKAEEKARNHECDTMELNVDIANNSAKKLYQKHDFNAERQRMVRKL